MKKFTVLVAVLGIAILLAVNASFGRVMYDYYKAHSNLVTDSNQRSNFY